MLYNLRQQESQAHRGKSFTFLFYILFWKIRRSSSSMIYAVNIYERESCKAFKEDVDRTISLRTSHLESHRRSIKHNYAIIQANRIHPNAGERKIRWQSVIEIETVNEPVWFTSHSIKCELRWKGCRLLVSSRQGSLLFSLVKLDAIKNPNKKIQFLSVPCLHTWKFTIQKKKLFHVYGLVHFCPAILNEMNIKAQA